MVRELRGASAAVTRMCQICGDTRKIGDWGLIPCPDCPEGAAATRARELLDSGATLGEAIRVLQRELGLSGSEARRALTGARAHEPEVYSR